MWLAGLIASVGISLLAPMSAEAACGGSSPNRVAASASRTDVNDCVVAAASGDTITVPAGSATWSSAIGVAKNVAIVGSGATSTLITSSADCFVIHLGFTTRISGFGFTNCTISSTDAPASGATFRIDHNRFTSASWRENLFTGGCQTPMRHPTGLIDNNTFHNYRVAVIYGSNCLVSEGSYQHQLWAQAPPIGSGTGIIYIEDNTIDGNVHQNWVDGNQGARWVGRFNTISGTTYMEVHSVQGSNRAVQWWELYKNTQTKPAADFYPLAYIRGGSGMVWGNRVSSVFEAILMNNVRSCRDPGDGVGKCTGTSNWDQNTSGMSGYACRDQIGRCRDTTQWVPGSAYAQPITPPYFWDNIKGTSTQYGVVVDAGEPCSGAGGDLNSAHLVENRDWYTQNTSFNGTTGVGMGPLASRPSACTAGVAYWATDQGEWNSRHPGADGQLYKCTATNTWSLHYTPYAYPHPLQVGGVLPPSPPTAPSNLTVAP